MLERAADLLPCAAKNPEIALHSVPVLSLA